MTAAREAKNKFRVFECDYTEHPDAGVWEEELRKNLGERGWRQELLREFLD